MNKITILLVDDHQLIMDAWTSLLNGDGRFAVLGTATRSVRFHTWLVVFVYRMITGSKVLRTQRTYN